MKKIILTVFAVVSLFNSGKSQSLNFDGVDDFVAVPGSGGTLDNLGASNLTIEAWIYSSTGTGVGSIIRKTGDYNLYLNNNVLNAEVWPSGIGNPAWMSFSGSTTIPTNTWTHVAFSWNQSLNTGALYINGVLETSTTSNNNVSGTEPLYIGTSSLFPQFFTGNMDEMRIWNITRTQGQIQDNMNCSFPGGKTGLVANYNFNEGIANGNNAGVTTLNDVSTFLNNGTLNNFALTTGSISNWVDDVNLISPVSAISISTGVTTACAGATVTFTATPTNGGTTPFYQWLKNGIPVGTDSSNYSDNTLTSSDVISCMLTPSILCAATQTSNTVSITIPVITVTGNAGICSGATSTLTASGMTSYTWSPNAGSATTATVSISPNTTDTYTVTGFDGTCAATATVNIHVTTSPTITVTGNTNICSGTSTTLTANGASTYTWNPGNSHLNTITTPNLSTSASFTLHGTTGTCSSSYTGTINVTPTPTLTISGAAPICSGDSILLTANTASTYTWSANAGSATTNTVSVKPGNSTTYTVTGANGVCAKTQTVTVFVSPTPTISFSGTTTICIGDSTTLTAIGAASYTWSANAASSTSYTITLKPTTTDTYTVYAATGACTNSDTISVTVNSVPNVTFDINPNLYCSTDPAVTLSATPTGGSYSGTGVSAGQFDPATAGVGTYTLSYIYTDGNNCNNNDTAVVSVQLCTTGINQFANSNVSIYPNPASDLMTIQSATVSENSVLEIYNNLGQKVSSIVLNDKTTQVNISNLSNGIYEVRITNNNATLQQIKFVKQ